MKHLFTEKITSAKCGPGFGISGLEKATPWIVVLWLAIVLIKLIDRKIKFHFVATSLDMF